MLSLVTNAAELMILSLLLTLISIYLPVLVLFTNLSRWIFEKIHACRWSSFYTNLQKTLFIKLILIHYPKKKKTDAKYLYKRCYLEKNLQPLKGWRSIWTPCGFSINVSSREMVKTCLFVTFKTVIRQLSLKDFIEIPQVF